jgi:TPR repeat protein
MDDDETMTCPTCHGEYKKEIGACKTCKGTGKVECQPCHGSGKVECQACNATGKFDIDKLVKAAIDTDWYDVESDKKVKKRALSDEDVTMLKSAAEQGHGGSCYVLGVLKGGNCCVYAEDGDSYFTKGAQAGNADCLYAHASVLLRKGQSNQKEAIECLERSAEMGNVHALVDLALCLFDKSGIASENEKALQYCEHLSRVKAAEGLSQHLVEKANIMGKCLPKIVKNDVAAMFEFGSTCDMLYKTCPVL